MSRPLVVTVPHNLGKEEARRRLQGGVGQLHAQFGDKISASGSRAISRWRRIRCGWR